MKIVPDLTAAPPPTARMTGILAMTLLLFANHAIAQEVFRWVDKDGKVHYGDVLPPPAEMKNLQSRKLGDSVIEQDAVPFAVATAMKNNPVTLYANDCGEGCTNARALLTKRGVPFSDKNPQTDAAAATALKAAAGGLQVPTIVIGTTNLSGFDENGWHAALDAAGYPRTNSNLRQGTAKAAPKAVAPEPAAK
jgi:glutaredoxin